MGKTIYLGRLAAIALKICARVKPSFVYNLDTLSAIDCSSDDIFILPYKKGLIQYHILILFYYHYHIHQHHYIPCDQTCVKFVDS